jgi:NAD(P) transhydrogenase
LRVKEPASLQIILLLPPGSRPYRPPGVDFSHPRMFDSDTILSLNFSPRKVTIIGAGVIGCEYASIFGGLGAKVELINPAALTAQLS